MCIVKDISNSSCTEQHQKEKKVNKSATSWLWLWPAFWWTWAAFACLHVDLYIVVKCPGQGVMVAFWKKKRLRKKSITGQSSRDHIKKVCFKGIESSQAPKVLRCSTHGSPGPEGNHISDVPLLDSPNPWLCSSLPAPSVVAPVTFASVVEEELQQEAALIRSRKKPVALIQIEECSTRFISFLWSIWQPWWVSHCWNDTTGTTGSTYVE